MMGQNFGPRHGGGYRPSETAALDAADQALSGEDKREIKTMLLSRIRPDASQPRDYFDPKSIKDFSEGLDAQTQLDPLKIRELWPDELAARTPQEVKDGVTHQLVDGERRYWGLKQIGKERAYVEIRIYRDAEHVLDEQNAQNIDREDMSLSAMCRSITRYIKEFKRDQKYLADNQFKKYAKGNAEWVGNRYRLWKKVKDDPDIVKLLQRHQDVLTHAELIVRAETKALKLRMIEAVDNGASVKDVRSMLPQKEEEPEPEPWPQPERNGITLNRQSAPEPAVEGVVVTAEELEQIARQQEQEEYDRLKALHEAFDFSDEPQWDAQSVEIAFSNTLNTLKGTEEKIRMARERPDFTELARAAWLTRLQSIRTQLDELEKLAQG